MRRRICLAMIVLIIISLFSCSKGTQIMKNISKVKTEDVYQVDASLSPANKQKVTSSVQTPYGIKFEPYFGGEVPDYVSDALKETLKKEIEEEKLRQSESGFTKFEATYYVQPNSRNITYSWIFLNIINDENNNFLKSVSTRVYVYDDEGLDKDALYFEYENISKAVLFPFFKELTDEQVNIILDELSLASPEPMLKEKVIVFNNAIIRKAKPFEISLSFFAEDELKIGQTGWHEIYSILGE